MQASIPGGAIEAAKVVGPQAKWLGAGQGTLGLAFILYIIGESTGLDFFSVLSGLSCVAGMCSFMVAGVVYGSAATAAGVGAAGIAGVSYNQGQEKLESMGVSREQQDHALAVAQRAKALHEEGIEPQLLFKQVAQWMASEGMTPGMLFTKLDLDGNGTLDSYELREGFARLNVADLPPWLMGSVIGMVDSDGDSEVSRDEWIGMFQQLGWKAPEPSIQIDNANPVAESTVTASFTAPPWPSDRKAWIGLMNSDVPHGSEAECDEHDVAFEYLDGRTEGTAEFTIPQGGFWDIRMFDSDHMTGAIEVASQSLVAAEKPIGEIPHYRDQGNEEPEELAQSESDEVLEQIDSDSETEKEHPLTEIISNLPQEDQEKAWETANEIESMIEEASSEEGKMLGQSMLSTFVDDIVHKLPVSEWASLTAMSAIAAGVGVAALKKGTESENIEDVDEPSIIEEEKQIAEVPGAEEESENLQEETTISEEIGDDTDFTEENIEDEIMQGPQLSQLVVELSSTRFMSEREEVLSRWNSPLTLHLIVDRTERTLGLGIPESHKGGMSIICKTVDGTAASVRMPTELNSQVTELKSGSSINCEAIPEAWNAGKKCVSLHSESFERVHL